jgi:Family of unknown function (DUF5681)
MTDIPTTPPAKHTGGKFRKGVSGNPGGRRKVNMAPPEAPQEPQAPQAGSQDAPQKAPHAGVEQPSNTGRNKDGTFAKGFVANPAGKPKGTRHAATRLAEAMIDGRAEDIIQKAIDMAASGDPTALRVVMDRLCPPRRERTVEITLPSIKSAEDLVAAAAAITDATAAGEITPSEAASMSTLVGNVAKAIEAGEIIARLERIEEQLGTKGLTP